MIDDVVSEAFLAWAVRVVVTAGDEYWLKAATASACGYGTSIIGCDAEAGVERWLEASQTPDGRVGAALLFFARKRDDVVAAAQNRAGQALMTCPTTAMFDGLPESAEQAELGDWLRWFGDGEEYEAEHAGRRGWRVPVSAGEFFCESLMGVQAAVAGGTLLIGGADDVAVLHAARRAVEVIADVDGVITPFPGGVCRCASKVGSRYYEGMMASTHDAYCPTLRERTDTRLPTDVSHVYEIVIDGLTREAVAAAMRAGVDAAAGEGVTWISANRPGGRLGTMQIPLREVVAGLPGLEGLEG